MMESLFNDDGFEIKYSITGAGPALVLLHSGSGSGTGDFSPFLAELSKRFRLITYDRPGYGESSPVSDLPPDYLDQESGRLIRLLDYLNIAEVSLWGWSDGMTIALKTAIAFPQRCKRVVAMSGHYQRAKSEQAARQLRRVVEKMPQFLPFARAVAAGAQLPGDFFDGKIAETACPVLFIHGENDPYTPVGEIEEMSRLVKNGRIIVCPDTGHAPHLKSPMREKLFIDILGFLSGNIA
jgi:pimeloyl-ACP methyl ester carboxylesterase